MSKKLLVLLAVLATAFATAIPVGLAEDNNDGEFGQTTTVEEGDFDSYIVVMQGDPLVVTLGQDALGTPAADAQAADLVEEQDEVLEEAGLDADDKVNTYVNALNGFSAHVTYEEAQELARNSKVALVMPDELYQPDTDSSPTYLGLDAPGNNGAWNSGFTGEGVVVGVIDTGIWPEHPSFADNGLATPSVLPLDETFRSACDFGSAHRPDEDAAFTCQNKLIGARQMIDTYRLFIPLEPLAFDSARDPNGHGTHTASTAAGNGGVAASAFGAPVGTISGIAPDAHVIAYKGTNRAADSTAD